MSYGSGNPFARSTTRSSNHPTPSYESYQNPPVIKATHQANNQAASVLNALSSQREQLLGARENARDTVETTKLAKVQLDEIRDKTRARIRRLYCIIGILAAVDIFLLQRMWQCGGSLLFCHAR
jgi:hypothetical protein